MGITIAAATRWVRPSDQPGGRRGVRQHVGHERDGRERHRGHHEGVAGMAGSGREDPRDHDADDRGDQRQLSEAGQRDLLALDGDGDVGGPGDHDDRGRRDGGDEAGQQARLPQRRTDRGGRGGRSWRRWWSGWRSRRSSDAPVGSRGGPWHPTSCHHHEPPPPGSTHGPPFLRGRGWAVDAASSARYFTSRRRLRRTPSVLGTTTQIVIAVRTWGRWSNGWPEASWS